VCTDAVAKKSPCEQNQQRNALEHPCKGFYPQRGGLNLPLPIDNRLAWVFNVGTLARCSLSHSVRRFPGNGRVRSVEQWGGGASSYSTGTCCLGVLFLVIETGVRSSRPLLPEVIHAIRQFAGLLRPLTVCIILSDQVRACRLPEYPSRMRSTFFYVYYEERGWVVQKQATLESIRRRLSQVDDEQGLWARYGTVGWSVGWCVSVKRPSMDLA